MKISKDTPTQFVLTLTPWTPWIISIVAGAAFLSFAIFDPAAMPGWALLFFGLLGIAAPLGFLASHAKITADFDKIEGAVMISRFRPIGGMSRQIIPLDQIIEVNHIIKNDVDNTDYNSIELTLTREAAVRFNDGNEHTSLTTSPVQIDLEYFARALGAWLHVPVQYTRID